MARPANFNGIVGIAAGTILAIASLALSSWNSMWEWLRVPQELRPGLIGALAVLFVNLGFLVAVYYQQNDFEIAMLESQRKELAAIRSLVPNADLFSHYSGDVAMEFITAILPTARLALNTRILSPRLSRTSHPALSPWDEIVKQSVKSGLTFREVVSPDNSDLVRGRASATAEGTGLYEAAILKHSLPSFLNFIMLEGKDGSKTVWFGWIVSRNAGYEGSVIRTSETRIVNLFERWHGELFNAGVVVATSSS